MKVTTARHQRAFKSQDKKQDKTVDKSALLSGVLREGLKCRREAARYYGVDTFYRKILCLSPFFIAMGGLEITASKLLKNPPFAKMKPHLVCTLIASATTIIGLAIEKVAYSSGRKGTYEQYKESADRLEGNVKKIFNAINPFKGEK